MKRTDSFLDIMKQALEAEAAGYALYQENAKKFKNPLLKKTFRAIAKDEKQHMKAITGFCLYAEKNKRYPALHTFLAKDHGEARKVLLAHPIKEGVSVDEMTEVLKVYDLAIKMEQDGYAFYEMAFKKAKEQDAKELLQFLMKEENAHYILLKEAKDYLHEPHEWFIKEEGRVMEG